MDRHAPPSPIDDLLGLPLTSFVFIEDYVQLVFDCGAAVVTINNPYTIHDPETRPSQSIPPLMGLRVLSMTTLDDSIELTFEGGWLVRVDIRAETYLCPEAMTLDQPGRPTVVWN